MAYVKPGLEDFLQRYPEFSDAGEDRILTLLDEAEGTVQDHWIERDRVPAMLAYVAFLISAEITVANTVESEIESGNTAGPVSRMTVGPLSVMYGRSSSSSSSGGSTVTQSQIPVDYESNPYGRLFMYYLRKSFPAAVAIA